MKLFKKICSAFCVLAVLAFAGQTHAMDFGRDQLLKMEQCGDFEVSFVQEDDIYCRCIKAFIMDPDRQEIGRVEFEKGYEGGDSLGDISGLYVFDSLYSGKGVGSCLIRLALDALRDQGCASVRLDPVPLPFNSEEGLQEWEFREIVSAEKRWKKLVKFYEKHGFNWSSNGGDEPDMRLQFDEDE